MCKASVVGDATRLDYSKVGNAKAGVYIDCAGIIDNYKPRGVECKVDIIGKKR